MKISWYKKILVSLGLIHLCKGKIKKHKWGRWVSAGNEVNGKNRTSKQKRICSECGLKQTRKTKEN